MDVPHRQELRWMEIKRPETDWQNGGSTDNVHNERSRLHAQSKLRFGSLNTEISLGGSARLTKLFEPQMQRHFRRFGQIASMIQAFSEATVRMMPATVLHIFEPYVSNRLLLLCTCLSYLGIVSNLKKIEG
jgi:hypothetical protein